MKKIGVYIHIPFCKKKCLYCDFISFSNKEEMQQRYIQALKKEIENWKMQNQDKEIETIYIGGGTPSYIDSKYIIEILDLFKISQKEASPMEKIFQKEASPTEKEASPMENTIEINPGTVTKQKLEDYKKAGIKRISIGLQSTQDRLLKQIGRIHTYQEFLQTYKIAREVGFNNINVDLMIGLPNQNIQDIKETLQTIHELKPCVPEHISVYSLIVEEETPLYKMIQSKQLELPDEEQERRMYWYVKNFLELNGYKHYEISNFAKKGFEAKHNLDCWNQKEYVGFGAAAHSYIDNKRFCNTSNLEKYIQNIEDGNYKNNIIVQEEQNIQEQMKEYMLLGLRKIDGVSIQAFEYKFNENPIMLFKQELQKLNENNLIIIDGDNIKLSNKGIDLANLVWEEFI